MPLILFILLMLLVQLLVLVQLIVLILLVPLDLLIRLVIKFKKLGTTDATAFDYTGSVHCSGSNYCKNTTAFTTNSTAFSLYKCSL